MKLVYQTPDMPRAREIAGLLNEAGIETSLHGVESQAIGHRANVTVWVLADSQEREAHQVLDAFFVRESPHKPVAAIAPASSTKKLVLFLFALAIGAGIAVLTHGI